MLYRYGMRNGEFEVLEPSYFYFSLVFYNLGAFIIK